MTVLSEPPVVTGGFIKVPLLTKEGWHPLRVTGWFSRLPGSRGSPATQCGWAVPDRQTAHTGSRSPARSKSGHRATTLLSAAPPPPQDRQSTKRSGKPDRTVSWHSHPVRPRPSGSAPTKTRRDEPGRVLSVFTFSRFSSLRSRRSPR